MVRPLSRDTKQPREAYTLPQTADHGPCGLNTTRPHISTRARSLQLATEQGAHADTYRTHYNLHADVVLAPTHAQSHTAVSRHLTLPARSDGSAIRSPVNRRSSHASNLQSLSFGMAGGSRRCSYFVSWVIMRSQPNHPHDRWAPSAASPGRCRPGCLRPGAFARGLRIWHGQSALPLRAAWFHRDRPG